MARLINGANGPFIGKAGSFIGYTVNGVGYMKGLYKKRTKAPTEKEALNRKKFAAAQLWLRSLTDFVRVGFKGYSQTFQGFAAAKSYLMKNALQVIDGKIEIDPSLVKVSFGTLPLPQNIQCNFQEPDTFNFQWTPIKSIEREAQAMAVVYDITEGQPQGFVFGTNVHSGQYQVYVGNPEGRTFYIYLAFIAADRSRQSDSVYLGTYEF